jgi:hypothetical protein
MFEIVELLAEPSLLGAQSERLKFLKHGINLNSQKTLCGQSREGYIIKRLGGDVSIEDPSLCPICRTIIDQTRIG